jgi:hypothetical protein
MGWPMEEERVDRYNESIWLAHVRLWCSYFVVLECL